MIIGNVLFGKGNLGAFLRREVDAIDDHVRGNVTAAELEMDDDALTAAMMADAKVGSLSVDFENPERNTEEIKVVVSDHFGSANIDGVRVTKSFAFSGNADLFDLAPSKYDSSRPRGVLEYGRVKIVYEGRRDPDAIKNSFADQEAQLRRYLEWSKEEVDAHDQNLPRRLKAAIEQRRKVLGEIGKLDF
ncbi:hypothetical protein R1521_31070 [Rhizobium brockwellii]|uniref:Uncharacterized protein n=1 Tax=Rhizobium brockwellii TaxID=3019932 RepID=A0ABU3YVZ2_9HYPH|nr:MULTISPECIES: hypothetical protein [Rhizobium]MDV4182959.1 hypothetical protein [Rhizobium brockwellii]MDV4189863.1 hypothetical protein [Rhizobium brockwellii]